MNLSGSDSKIGLALSGGGFRATLFHLGVIRYLRSTDRLKNVSHIAAVSGGSILAAHLAANWKLYTGSFEEFLRASELLLKFTARDIRGRIVRRLPWLMLRQLMPRFVPLSRSLPRSTTDLLRNELRRLYGDVNLADLLALAPDSPKLSLLATNLTHPGITAFENERIVNYPLHGSEKPWEGTSVPLHLAVACSAAYPAFFPPLAVSYEDVLAPDDYGVQYHSDGGVIDNQGLQTIFANKEVETIIISDAASVSIDSQPTAHFGILTTGLRSMELMMAQIRSGHYASVTGSPNRSPIVIDIEPEKEDLKRNHWGTVYSQLPQVRTDLDEFDAIERQELVHHGYFSAQEKLKLPVADPSFLSPEPSRGLPAKVARHLRSRSGFRLGIISWKDHVAVINLLVLVLGLGFLAWEGPKAVQAVSDFMVVQAASELRSKPLGIIPSSGEIPLEVGDVGERPTNPGFTVTAEDRVWDLRNLQISDKEGIVEGPAYMTRYTELRREKESAIEYSYRFETSGKVRAWKGNGDSRLGFRLIGPPPRAKPTAESGPSTLHVYKCIVDCRHIPVGETFTIVIQAQYNDAFLKRENWWTGMIVSDKMKRVSMRIVFPPHLPFQNPSFRRYPNGSRLESVTFEGKALNIGGQPELLWTVSPPISGSTYRVNWDWYPDA
ncbi:MAG TPA: patatin-like phospholipase family protein [Thermoanaerobaculia bacterium]|nr:patatin-like phospholipase family protein [Thermoanaerobaculia bacterium]